MLPLCIPCPLTLSIRTPADNIILSRVNWILFEFGPISGLLVQFLFFEGDEEEISHECHVTVKSNHRTEMKKSFFFTNMTSRHGCGFQAIIYWFLVFIFVSLTSSMIDQGISRYVSKYLFLLLNIAVSLVIHVLWKMKDGAFFLSGYLVFDYDVYYITRRVVLLKEAEFFRSWKTNRQSQTKK